LTYCLHTCAHLLQIRPRAAIDENTCSEYVFEDLRSDEPLQSSRAARACNMTTGACARVHTLIMQSHPTISAACRWRSSMKTNRTLR
jgi:hypothetical protein